MPFDTIMKMMRLGCFLLLLLTLKVEVKAQYNVIKADLVPIFISDPRVFRPSYERSFGKHVSALLTFEFGRYGYGALNDSAKTQVMETTGWGILPEFRVFPFGKKNTAPFGFYFGPHLMYRQLKERYYLNNTDITSRAYQRGLGFHTGYKIGFLNRLSLDVLLGYTIGSGTWTSTNGDRSRVNPQYGYDNNKFSNYFRAEVSLGFVFPKPNDHTSEKSRKRLKDFAAPMEEDSTSAQLIIYRPYSFEGTNVEFDLFINDSLITRIKEGTYHTYETRQSGTYSISGVTEDSVAVDIQLSKGYIYYLECTIGAGTTVGLPKFKLVPQEKAEKKIKLIYKKRE